MTKETRSIINKRLDKLFTDIVDSTYIGLIKEMSSNDPEFWNTYNAILEDTNEYIIKYIEGKTDDE